MSFSGSFFDELEKTAFEMGGVKFRRYGGGAVSRRDISRQAKPIIRESVTGLFNRFPFNVPKLSKAGRDQLTNLIHKKFKGNLPYVAGFAIPGGGVAGINLNRARIDGMTRDTLAHEAFHAKHPILGRSETLARFAGGFKAPRKFDAAGKPTSTLARVGSGISSVARYLDPETMKKYYPSSPLRPLVAGAHAVKSLFSRASPKLGGLGGDDISERLKSGNYGQVSGVFSRNKS